MTTKSPFYIIQEFVSPLLCEQMVDSLDFIEPDTNSKDEPTLTIKRDDSFERVIYQYVQQRLPEIEAHYDVQYRGMKPVEFRWYPMNYAGDEKITCENSTYVDKRKVWVKNKDRDLTAILFLSNFNAEVPFDSSYEVYGGKYEFPQHNFGFNAERGTLIVYPSGPHFLNSVTDVKYGDLFLAKFHIATAAPFVYNPKDFPGDMRSWFEHIA